MEKNIKPILDILYKKYNANDKTTLNRMRKKPDSFKILISCLLSLRAKDETTDKISKELYKVANTPEQIANMPSKKLEKIIFSTGHYRKKAQILKSVSKELIENFKSKVPETREKLMSIKGIGPKTANIVLAFAFGKQVIPVDTHVHRIPNRIGWVKTKLPEKTEKELMKIIPKKYISDFNAVFVQFGRDLCQPVSPWCSKCPIKENCERVGVNRSR
jgi:endonuclease III